MMPLLGGVLEEDTLRLGFTGYMSMITLSGGNETLLQSSPSLSTQRRAQIHHTLKDVMIRAWVLLILESVAGISYEGIAGRFIYNR
jgi:hypothetical protein